MEVVIRATLKILSLSLKSWKLHSSITNMRLDGANWVVSNTKGPKGGPGIVILSEKPLENEHSSLVAHM